MTTPLPCLLVLEPEPVQLSSWRTLLEKAGYRVCTAATTEAARRLRTQEQPDLQLLNLDTLGTDEHSLISAHSPLTLVHTARGSVSDAVTAMRAGAYDFLMLPVAPEKLLVSVRNALAHRQLAQTVAHYREHSRPGFQGFIGSSAVMQAIYRVLEQAASSRASVFITGESGTGKEVAAQAIHALSERRAKPFVALNCAAIPKDLMESEVFGHVKGAFTGATGDRAGAARLADGGTLFLDEIGEMDMQLQSKLLRFVQTGSFQRVGSSAPEQVDVRIVCATNRDPLAEVQAGRFREDLYYRLHVLPITLPPLRERGADVLEIATYFLQQIAAEEGKDFRSFTPEAQGILQHYDWPGNIRQLHNIIRNIVVLHSGEVVQPAMIPPPVGGRWARPYGPHGQSPSPKAVPDLPGLAESTAIRPLAEVERSAIEQAIAACDGNIPKAAALLGVNPSTIYRKQQGWRAL